MNISRSSYGLSLVVLSLVILVPATALAGDEWKPVDPADLASKTPVVAKDADAEGLFWG